mgnify:CR=1 FL=1
MTARMRLQPQAVGQGMTSQRVRDRLVERLREGSATGQGITDEHVLNVIRTLPRHLFVDEVLASRAYECRRRSSRASLRLTEEAPAEVPAEVPAKLVAEAASMAPPASRRPANREMRFIWTSFQGRPSLRPLPQD